MAVTLQTFTKAHKLFLCNLFGSLRFSVSGLVA